MGKRVKQNKKAYVLTACLCMMFVLMLSMISVKTKAADINTPYLGEQAIGKAPNVKVYVTGSKMSKSIGVSGTVEDIKFSQDGDIQTFGDAGEGMSYIFLLDNSGSVNESQFNEVKNQLVALRKNLKKKDTLAIYTVGTKTKTGEKTNVLGKTVKGEDKKSINNDVKKINNIQKLGSDSQTVLYRSINQILASMDTPAKRTALILVTDGEDESEGKDMNKTNTLDEVKSGIIPVYGILLNTKKGSPDRKKIEYTKDKILAEKNCRGYYHDCSTTTSADVVKKAFTKLHDIFYKQTYVVNLKANTNKTVGDTTLKLKMGEKSSTSVRFNYSNYEADDVAPNIEGEIEATDKNVITFTIYDQYGVNITDANDISHYKLQYIGKKGKKSEDEESDDKKSDDKKSKNEKFWTLEDVKAEKNGQTAEITLVTKENLYKGAYRLSVAGIRDSSADANKMSETVEFTVEKGVNAFLARLKEILKSYWWILLMLLIAIIGAIVIVLTKKKSVKIVEIDPDELNKAESKLIRLTITDRTGMIKNLEWNVEGSLFVGRSSINNIYFDDDRLSKQHFVIEVTKLGCHILDLDSTNGTFVNGVRIHQKRLLLDGDIVTAGREKFEYHFPRKDIENNEQ